MDRGETMIDEILANSMNEFLNMSVEDENRYNEGKMICQLLHELNENERLLRDRHLKESENAIREREVALKEKQIINDRIKAAVDVFKTALPVAAFVFFERLAHERDMADVIDRAATHVRKNPMKLMFK